MQRKQSSITQLRGEVILVCGALCVQVLCPRTVQSEEEGIQKLNATFPTLERDMFPRITSSFFFFFLQTKLCDHYAKSIMNMKKSQRGGRCKEQLE